MSYQSSPGRKQNPKQLYRQERHKGVRTSLIGRQSTFFNPQNHIQNGIQRVYVQVDKNAPPHVEPYISSGYNQNESYAVNEATSQYIPSAQQIRYQQIESSQYEPYQVRQNNRQNNHIYIHPPIQQVPAYISNLSSTKVQMQKSMSKSKFVPPPPQAFLVHNNYSPIKVSSIPISTPINTTSHSIKKTYIPHHIYNEIPIYKTPQPQQNEEQYEENDKGQEFMMQQYEKLHRRHQQDKQVNFQLNNYVLDLEQQLDHIKKIQQNIQQQNVQQPQQQQQPPQTIIQRVVQRVEVPIEKRKRIDVNRLQQLMQDRFSNVINDVVNVNRNSCINRVGQVFARAQNNIKHITSTQVQQSTITSTTVRPSY